MRQIDNMYIFNKSHCGRTVFAVQYSKIIVRLFPLLLFVIPVNALALSDINSIDSIDSINRIVIHNYIEKATNAYPKRDKKLLSEFWSMVPDTSHNNRKMSICGHYKPHNKSYWDMTLRKAFKNDKHIEIIQKEINIVLHPLIKWMYGVTLHLEINGKKYFDEGYMFMVWDFRNKDVPQIHIRTWQPGYRDKEKRQKLNPSDVYTLADFDL